jgi:Protein of unknown function (DUF4099)
MKKYLFQFSEIPYRQFHQLGMEAQEVQRLFSLEDIERLLMGKCTGLKKNILLKNGHTSFQIDAKFLLTRGRNNLVDLMVFSRKEKVEEEYGLNEQQLKILERGGVLKIQDPLSKQEWWVQLDKTINRLFRAADSYVKTLKQMPLPSHYEPNDLDYYDWEYIVHRFETQNLVLEGAAEKSPISVKDFLKNIQSESHAFSQSIFEKYGGKEMMNDKL